MPHENEISPPITTRLLDSHDIGGRLDYTQLRSISLWIGANFTDWCISQHATTLTMTHGLNRTGQADRQSLRRRTRVLEEMESHALRTLGPNARQCAQRLDQIRQCCRVLH